MTLRGFSLCALKPRSIFIHSDIRTPFRNILRKGVRPVLFSRTFGYLTISFFGGVSAFFMRTTVSGETYLRYSVSCLITKCCELLFVRPAQTVHGHNSRVMIIADCEIRVNLNFSRVLVLRGQTTPVQFARVYLICLPSRPQNATNAVRVCRRDARSHCASPPHQILVR